MCDQYAIQGDRFAEAILNDALVPIPLEDAVRNMEVIEAVVASSCSGGWVRLGAADRDLEARAPADMLEQAR